MTGEIEGAIRPGRETMKATRTLLALMLIVVSCTSGNEEARETLSTVIEEIERVEQVNIDNPREIADNYNILERTQTPLRFKLEERMRAKLQEWEHRIFQDTLESTRKRVTAKKNEQIN